MIQLFPDVPRDRISTLSCAHVIPKTNLLTQVVSLGPRKREFELKFANRDDEGLVSYPTMWLSRHRADVPQLNELGAVIQSVVGLVPDGVVVFLPSYAFLDKVKKLWTQSGLLAKLDDKKQVRLHLLDVCGSPGSCSTSRRYQLASRQCCETTLWRSRLCVGMTSRTRLILLRLV